MSGFINGKSFKNSRCKKINMPISSLGCGPPGIAPKLLGQQQASGVVSGGPRGLTRIILRKAFGNNKWYYNYSPLLGANPNLHYPQTPFRLAMSAGDPFGTLNQAPKKGFPNINQVSRGGLTGSMLPRVNGGAISTGEAGYTGNPKYVYDSSVYTRFSKDKAQNQNYNDISFGGDQSSASQTPLRKVRRGFS